MLDRLINALVASSNEAADDLLLEALQLGNDREQEVALDGLIRRETTHGLGAVIGRFAELTPSIQHQVMEHIKAFHHAIRECARSDNKELRLSAMKLLAMGRQGKLAYTLSDSLHHSDETISKAACEAMVALARWVSVETRRLQRGHEEIRTGETQAKRPAGAASVPTSPLSVYQDLMAQRPEIELAVARALDVHRGRHGQDLLRAAMLLADWSGSQTLAIVTTARHGGQSLMVRRLQQSPESEHVEAFLLGASVGGLRSHFGITFSQIDEAPVLDALLRKTHWLKEHHLQQAMQQVTRGTWWGEVELQREIERRDPLDAAKVAEWLAVSGMHDVSQDERFDRIRIYAQDSFAAKLRLLMIAARRKKGASVAFLRAMLNEADERLVRMAAREIVRRRPADFENMLLQLMTTAPESVRGVIARAVGQSGFEQFWTRFDKLDRSTRRQAGRAMLKLLPDAPNRLAKRLLSGPMEQRIKAMQITQELKLAEQLKEPLIANCSDPNPRLRSKAVSVLGDLPSVTPDLLIEKLISDSDPRVRANAIEVLESKGNREMLPVLIQRAQQSINRERANAIKALHKLKVQTFSSQLQVMLHDPRSEHRISALWALRQVAFWPLLKDVVALAKQDENLRVRRYAVNVLRQVSEVFHQEHPQSKAG